VTIQPPQAIVDAVARVAKRFEVVGVVRRFLSFPKSQQSFPFLHTQKNGMRRDFKPPVSGYRDLKLLIRFPLPRDVEGACQDILGDKHTAKFQKGTKFVCEIQFLLEKYLENKLTSSTRYKIRRAANWGSLVSDFRKYIKRA